MEERINAEAKIKTEKKTLSFFISLFLIDAGLQLLFSPPLIEQLQNLKGAISSFIFFANIDKGVISNELNDRLNSWEKKKHYL